MNDAGVKENDYGNFGELAAGANPDIFQRGGRNRRPLCRPQPLRETRRNWTGRSRSLPRRKIVASMIDPDRYWPNAAPWPQLKIKIGEAGRVFREAVL
jgi:hypothetical protein